MRVIFLTIFILFSKYSFSFSENYNFQKLVSLNEPWGSSFISNTELIITEKTGKIKLFDILSNKIIPSNQASNRFKKPTTKNDALAENFGLGQK